LNDEDEEERDEAKGEGVRVLSPGFTDTRRGKLVGGGLDCGGGKYSEWSARKKKEVEEQEETTLSCDN
jgi:hypothetical protein